MIRPTQTICTISDACFVANLDLVPAYPPRHFPVFCATLSVAAVHTVGAFFLLLLRQIIFQIKSNQIIYLVKQIQ